MNTLEKTENAVARAGKATQRAKVMPREERRKALLLAARSIVRERGAASLTMQGLADAAGVSKPVVYEHFTNGDAVAIALLDDYFEQAVEAVATATRDAKTLAEYLELTVDAEFDFQSVYRLSPWEITNGYSSSERLNQAYRDLRKVTLQTFEELLIQQGADQSVAEIAGFVLAGMLTNAVYEFADRPDSTVARATLKTMLDSAMTSILSSPTERPVMPGSTLENYRRVKSRHDNGTG